MRWRIGDVCDLICEIFEGIEFWGLEEAGRKNTVDGLHLSQEGQDEALYAAEANLNKAFGKEGLF